MVNSPYIHKIQNPEVGNFGSLFKEKLCKDNANECLKKDIKI